VLWQRFKCSVIGHRMTPSRSRPGTERCSRCGWRPARALSVEPRTFEDPPLPERPLRRGGAQKLSP
jgi:hypothetical protein